MRKGLILLVCILGILTQNTVAQENNSNTKGKKTKSSIGIKINEEDFSHQNTEENIKTHEEPEARKAEMFRDRLIVDLFHTFWLGAPSQMNNAKFNPGFNVSVLWDFKAKPSSPISFGLGAGCQYHTLFSDAILKESPDGKMNFYVLPESLYADDYKPDIVRMTYISCYIPLEFRYRHSNGFKFTVGGRLGLNVEVSQRYKGNDFNNPDHFLNYKSYEVNGRQKINFDLYMRCGWQFVSVYYSFQVNKLFEKGQGPAIQPMTLGISLSIF